MNSDIQYVLQILRRNFTMEVMHVCRIATFYFFFKLVVRGKGLLRCRILEMGWSFSLSVCVGPTLLLPLFWAGHDKSACL